MAERIDLLQGTLDVMILRTLQWGAQHVHGITSRDSHDFRGRPASGARLALSRVRSGAALHIWLEGDLTVDDHTLREGEYAYLPEGSGAVVMARAVIEKPYVPIERVSAPPMLLSHDVAIQARPLVDDS